MIRRWRTTIRRSILAIAMLVASMAHALAAVDANTATQAELRTVPGIGPAIAERIVKERRRTPYQDVADLQQRVRGIGDANIRRMVEGGLVVGAVPDTPATKARSARTPARTSRADGATSTAVGRGVLIERPAPAASESGAVGAAEAPKRER